MSRKIKELTGIYFKSLVQKEVKMKMMIMMIMTMITILCASCIKVPDLSNINTNINEEITKKKIKVAFVSIWRDGEVETVATLDLRTGIVSEIETSDEGAHYEELKREEIRINGISAKVERLDNGEYVIEEIDDIEIINESLSKK